jgi:hypothetical protein
VKKLDYKDHDMLEIRKETLGQNIICQDRQPSLLSRRPFTQSTLAFITAFIPVLRENYKCFYDPANQYKPVYTKVSEKLLEEDTIFGILTTQDIGFIPPTTMCRGEDG